MSAAVPSAPLDPPNADVLTIAGLSGPLLVIVAIVAILGVLLVINRLPKR
jgi:hypothetical protein